MPVARLALGEHRTSALSGALHGELRVGGLRRRFGLGHHLRNGALAGTLVGAVTVVVWKQNGWLGLYEIVPGFIFAWLATVVVSRLGQPSVTMLKKHQAVETELRTAEACGAAPAGAARSVPM